LNQENIANFENIQNIFKTSQDEVQKLTEEITATAEDMSKKLTQNNNTYYVKYKIF
jgi:cell fate (sporulation/competence/biofilm development) regulator YlbF (YheA/YmcA/DUF963 family)